jgi:hypothetical protein
MPTKEEIYDEQINPMMAQIINICKEHKIAMLCDFSLDLDSGLKCTTALLEDDHDPPEEMLRAMKTLKPAPRSVERITITHPDGSKEIITLCKADPQ